jgi:uncharacterized protein (DUF1501 family)
MAGPSLTLMKSADMSPNRRKFLIASGVAGTSLALPSFAQVPTDSFGDYKALVCIFLYGGNDSINTLLPTAQFAAYQTVRGQAPYFLAQSTLLPVRLGGVDYGLNPRLPALQAIMNANRAAALFNVGSLAEPMTKAQYFARQKERPEGLFSHSDQQAQWQSSTPETLEQTGWAGRLADRMVSANPSGLLPLATSMGGNAVFAKGVTSLPYVMDGGNLVRLDAFENANAARPAEEYNVATFRREAMARLQAIDDGLAMQRSANGIIEKALRTADLLAPIMDAGLVSGTGSTQDNGAFTPALRSNRLANQLLAVAKIMKNRAALGMRRQVFFVSQGGYDTHANQQPTHDRLMTELNAAIGAWQQAVDALGLGGNVTTFTASDFGRTLKPASGAGTDHAWGGHHFIWGGAVRAGGYGVYPELRVGAADDVSGWLDGQGRQNDAQGRWLPTTSVDQYAATLAKWFGLRDADRAYVLPNLARFASPDMGFMMA